MKNSPKTLKIRNEKRAYWKKTIDPKSIPAYKTGLCKECKKLSQLKWSTNFSSTGKPEYWPRCFDCHNAFLRRRRRRAQKRISEMTRRRKLKVKNKCVNYLGGRCKRCGYDKSLRALTFHHRDREIKDRNLCGMFDLRWDRIRSELDKCDLVCFNCHMELEEEYERDKRRLNVNPD